MQKQWRNCEAPKMEDVILVGEDETGDDLYYGIYDKNLYAQWGKRWYILIVEH